MDTVAYVILSALAVIRYVARLLLVRRRQATLMGKFMMTSGVEEDGLHDSSGTSDAAAPYLSIVTMLIESYVLDCAWSIGPAISAAVQSPSFRLFVINDSRVKVCGFLRRRGYGVYEECPLV